MNVLLACSSHPGELNPRPAVYEGTLAIRGYTEPREKGSTVDSGAPEISPLRPPRPIQGPNADAPDAIEQALAKALTEAAGAGRFDVVAQLARELEARRHARAGNVVALDPKTRRRGT
jgi:hypothetical protein